EHKYRYGYRKITAILKVKMRINHKTVQRIMQKNQWQCRVKMKKRKKNGQIAFTIGDKQDTDFILNTLDQLPALPENCVLHSDQGSVYTSYEYQKAVHIKGITMSMSRKGTPADNASIESFHSSLKSETFYLNSIDRTTTTIVERTVKEYIYYYNNIRIQTKLNNQSPINYRQLAV
ncbi:IS3 family transposase, partial [Bacillus safensis]|uniref:IS3 family transposase n=1 Tax=Bacillus safensis TaxID=561879 RepID=UPI002DBA89C3